jgi:predicted deacylase
MPAPLLTPATPLAHVTRAGVTRHPPPPSSDGGGGGGSGRRAVVVVALHGDEPAGVAAVNALAAAGALPALATGWACVTLVVGNPRALEAGVRFISKNLNRLFTPAALAPSAAAPPSSAAPPSPCYETQRARELAPLLTAASLVLDLHTASAPTPPFALRPPASPASAALAAALPVAYAVDDATGAGLGLAIEAAAAAGAAAVTVECGQHAAPASVDAAAACIVAALSGRRGAASPPQSVTVRRGETVRPGFRWAGGAPPPAFSRVAPGAIVAADDERGDILCDIQGGAIIVMPTAAPVVGEDAWLWGEAS